MKIIKLNAIDSTNDYLKELSNKQQLQNFTVVTANYQLSGKGQLQNKWHSEDGKNLLFSVLINSVDVKINRIFNINILISIAIFDVISAIIPNVKIKWPNDIMSRNNKLCGILIENTIVNKKVSRTIIGVGLNVNQLIFPKKINNVTSICKELGNMEINKEDLLIKITKQISYRYTSNIDEIKKIYLQNLYQINKPATYKNKENKLFLGKIVGITNQGKLIVEKENESLEIFANKEISYL